MWERALTSAPCRINNPIIATFRAATGLPPSVQITSGLRISQQAACINDVQSQLSRASISAPQPVSVLRASSRGPYSVAVRSSVSPQSFWADTSAPQFSGGAMTVGLSVRGPIPVSEPDASQTIGSRFNGVVHVMNLARIKFRAINAASSPWRLFLVVRAREAPVVGQTMMRSLQRQAAGRHGRLPFKVCHAVFNGSHKSPT